MTTESKADLIWGIVGQVIILLLASATVDNDVSNYALIAASAGYWLLFAKLIRRKRSRADVVFLRFGMVILYLASWTIFAALL